MNRRVMVVAATALMIVGAFIVTFSTVGGSGLQAAEFGQASYDLTKILTGVGVGTLILSAILFLSASSK